MKTCFYLVLTCVIFAPAVFLLFSEDIISKIIFCAYIVAIYFFIPEKVWRNILRANLRCIKLLEG